MVLEGFATVEEFVRDHGSLKNIYFPTTGFFVQVDGDPKSMGLFDEYSHIKYPMGQVSFERPRNNALEGIKYGFRPFVIKKNDDQTISIVTPGDKVKISYIGGSLYNPLVGGSIESLSVIEQVAFLKLDPKNLDRKPTRFENLDYILEVEDDGHGNLNLNLTGKNTDTGTGNVNITVTGKDNTQGQINLATNGPIGLKQVDKDGKTLNEITMSPTADIALEITDQYKNDLQIGKDGINIVDANKNSVAATKNGIKTTDKNGNVIEMNSSELNIVPKTLCNIGSNPTQLVNNFPVCVFSGAPHSTSTDVKV